MTTTQRADAVAMTEQQLEAVAGGKAGGYEPGARYVDWKAYMRARCMSRWNSTPESNREHCSDYE